MIETFTEQRSGRQVEPGASKPPLWVGDQPPPPDPTQ